ncbi:MAG: hypothetical protein LBK05_09885, partial [Treponema sp.]|nr:hypothetical protein [Treponema sp.]
FTKKFGIKPDGIINFLSNVPPFELTQRLRYRAACRAEAHYKDTGKEIIILLCGGDKAAQQTDISKARHIAALPLEEERKEEEQKNGKNDRG